MSILMTQSDNQENEQVNALSEAALAETSQPLYSKPSFWAALLILIAILIGGIYYSSRLFRSKLEKENGDGPNVQKIIERGKLIIGTDATYPPMEYLDENGKLIGYDVDLGNEIAQEFGAEAEFKNIIWDDLFDALLNEEVDLILAGVSITDERKALYDFSQAYLNAGMVIITQKQGASISSTNDLAGKKIGVQAETTNEEEALKYTSREQVIGYENFELATQALVQGKVDAIFSDLTNAKSIVSENTNLKIASDPFTSDYYGIVFRKGESDLTDKVDLVLNTLRQRGILTLFKQKWLE